MKSSYILIKLSLSVACLLLYNAVVFAQDPELVRRFDYDAKAPLDLKIIGSQKRGDSTVYDITYASPKGGVVPAYLVVPATGKGPFAAVVWGHWYWTNSEMRNRKQFLDRCHAQARPADQADGRTAGSRHRQGRQGIVDHFQPSPERGSPGADDPGRPAGHKAAAADAAGMAIAEIDLRFQRQDLIAGRAGWSDTHFA